MEIYFEALPTSDVEHIRRTRHDAYGQPVHLAKSDGIGTPCRHCLRHVPAGQDYLILAHRPFGTLSPFAETGPIFLCAAPCERAVPRAGLPDCLDSSHYLLRGYTGEEWIAYGTGRIVECEHIQAYARELLVQPHIAFVDLRSASNNCWQARIRRG